MQFYELRGLRNRSILIAPPQHCFKSNDVSPPNSSNPNCNSDSPVESVCRGSLLFCFFLLNWPLIQLRSGFSGLEYYYITIIIGVVLLWLFFCFYVQPESAFTTGGWLLCIRSRETRFGGRVGPPATSYGGALQVDWRKCTHESHFAAESQENIINR